MNTTRRSSQTRFLRHGGVFGAALFLLALAIRLWGVNFGLPHLYHADEPIVVNHALAYGLGDFNPHFFKIPPLVSYLLFAVYGIYYLLGHAAGMFPSLRDFEFLFYSDPSSFYLIGRLLFGVLLGSLTVLLWYHLIRRHFGDRMALLSGALFAVAFLHVRQSHYLYADIPLLFVSVLFFRSLFGGAASGASFRRHCVLGAWIGLAAAIKYNGIFLMIPYTVFLLDQPPPKRGLSLGLAAWASAAATFALLNPYAILDTRTFASEILEQARSHGNVGWLRHLTYSLRYGIGLPCLSLALTGMAVALGRILSSARARGLARTQMAAFLAYVIGYYVVISGAGQPYARYALPLVPFLIFFASLVIDSFWAEEGALARGWAYRARIAVFSGMVFVSVLPNVAASIRFDQIMSAKDTRTEAKEWIEKHLRPGSRIALDWDFYMPRLNFSRQQLEKKSKKIAAQGLFARPRQRRLEYLIKTAGQRTGFELYFFSEKPETQDRFLFAEPLIPYDWDSLRRLRIRYILQAVLGPEQKRQPFFREIRQHARLLREFSPYYRAAQNVPIDSTPLTGGPLMPQEFRARRSNGLILRLYEVA